MIEKLNKFFLDNRYNSKKLLLIILLITAFLRIYRLDYPNSYVFDEVYHAFTAKEYLLGHKEAWEYWTTPPPNVAYEWTHPPLAKEIMTMSMAVFHTTDAWAYRLPGALTGIISVYLVYLLGKRLFKDEAVGLISAFVFSLDGLNFVQSRTGMNDIYFVTLMLASFFFLIRKNFAISAIFLGLSLSSKWSAVYLFGVYFLILLLSRKLSKFVYFIIFPPIIYLLSYIPFFLLGHNWEQFIALQQQMWWYHTGLKASHDYSSPWWSWPLDLYPVWYFVEYHKNETMSNIFAGGNPFVFWMGFGAILVSIYDWIKLKNKAILLLLLGYFAFILPWALSPRIMFLYHYSPSIPFMSLILGHQLSILQNDKNSRIILGLMLALVIISFLIFYPIFTGLPLPRQLMLYFFKTNITKNPFGE